MRIVALFPENAVNAIYRVLAPMQALAKRGHAVHVNEGDIRRAAPALAECDLVLIWRMFGEPLEGTVAKLKERGVAAVWDNDDDIQAVPKNNFDYRRQGGLRGERTFQQMKRMVRLADVVTTTTPTLAALYEGAGGVDVRVLENRLPPMFVRPRLPRAHGAVVIGWVAATEHRYDLDTLRIDAALARVLERHPRAKVVSVGLHLGIDHPRYQRVETQLYARLPDVISTFDVGISPLAENRMNRARSNVKLKEYAACGVPWLASPIGPYAHLGEAEGGRLVQDDRWTEEIGALVADEAGRQRLGQRAFAWARSETIGNHVEQWEQAFEDALERVRVGMLR